MKGIVAAIVLAPALLLTPQAVQGQSAERIPGGTASEMQSAEQLHAGVAVEREVREQAGFEAGDRRQQQESTGQEATEGAPLGVASDWTQHHIHYPAPGSLAVFAKVRSDPRWLQHWILRHPEAWWQQRRRGESSADGERDWSVTVGKATFEPLLDFNFDIAPETGNGSLNTTDELVADAAPPNGSGQEEYLATAGSLTMTGGADIGTYALVAGGPGQTTSPLRSFNFDDLITAYYPSTSPAVDYYSLVFNGPGLEINFWYNPTGQKNAGLYSYYDSTGLDSNGNGVYPTTLDEAGTVNTFIDPGGGQTYPAKYIFNVNTNPSCSSDFVALGIPANAAAAGQANIAGWNSLYTNAGGTGYCTGTGPSVAFAYASGSGEVPASVALSQNGKQLAYVENRLTGSSYFHVLTIGTTGSNGTSVTAAVAPSIQNGVTLNNNNNASDWSVQLTPDNGTTNQSSTTAPWVEYTSNAAYVTTYSWSSTVPGTGTGYLYKIGGVFNGGTPAIVWKVPLTAVASSPVYDTLSNKIFFTDSNGNIDFVTDNGSSGSTVTSLAVATGSTSLNPVTVDSVNGMVYATFNTNGGHAVVVQAPTSLASSVAVNIGTGTNIFTGPYGVDFNNAWYANGPDTTGTSKPILYVAGTGSGTVPTLYGVPFTAAGAITATGETNTALATGMADSSPVTEFYNATTATDYLFAGVTNHCRATTNGGTAGCVMSLNITGGAPTVAAGTTAIAAAGGSSGIIVDNNANTTTYPQGSSCYYATKTGATLVKATQSGLQ